MNAVSTIGESLRSIEIHLAEARKLLHQPAHNAHVEHQPRFMNAKTKAPPKPQSSSILTKIQEELAHVKQSSYRTPAQRSKKASVDLQQGAKTEVKQPPPQQIQSKPKNDIFSSLYNRGMKSMKKKQEIPSYNEAFAFKPNSTTSSTIPLRALPSRGAISPNQRPLRREPTHPITAPKRSTSASNRPAGGSADIWSRLYKSASRTNTASTSFRTVNQVSYAQHQDPVEQTEPPKQTVSPPKPVKPVGIVERLMAKERERETRLEQKRLQREEELRQQMRPAQQHRPATHGHLRSKKEDPLLTPDETWSMNSGVRPAAVPPVEVEHEKEVSLESAPRQAQVKFERTDAMHAVASYDEQYPDDYCIDDSFDMPADEELAVETTTPDMPEPEDDFKRPVVAPLNFGKLRRR